MKSKVDEHWLFCQEELVASYLIYHLDMGLYQILELWIKTFKYNHSNFEFGSEQFKKTKKEDPAPVAHPYKSSYLGSRE
jgi:hypothetical protein